MKHINLTLLFLTLFLLLSALFPAAYADCSNPYATASQMVYDNAEGEIVTYQDGTNEVDISTDPNTQTFLPLFGIGMDLNDPNLPDYAYIGDQALEVLYAGSQLEYTGLGQLTLKLPSSPHGRRIITITGSVDRNPLNAIEVKLK